MKEGIERKACPACGGQIIVSDHWMFSYNQLLGKRGKLLKKRTKVQQARLNARRHIVWIAKKCGMPTSS